MDIQVLLVHPDSYTCNRLAEKLRNESGLHLVDNVCTGQAALVEIMRTPPDVVVMAQYLPDMDGIQASSHILRAFPCIKVLIQMEAINECSLLGILDSGASGCLTPDCTSKELTTAIRTVFQGKSHFCAECQKILVERCLEITRS